MVVVNFVPNPKLTEDYGKHADDQPFAWWIYFLIALGGLAFVYIFVFGFEAHLSGEATFSSVLAWPVIKLWQLIVYLVRGTGKVTVGTTKAVFVPTVQTVAAVTTVVPGTGALDASSYVT